VIKVKIDNLMGDNRGVYTLSMVNMLGRTGEGYEQGLAKDIWDDIIKARYEELGTDKDGEILGKYVHGSGSEILLDKDLLEGGREGSAKLAAVMAHEGTHLTGNRYEGIAHLQGNSTYESIKAIFGLQGDSEFSGNMIAAILNPESWTRNTGDVDNWINVKGDQKDIDAFKQFIYEKTGYTISVGAKGGVSIENSNSYIGDQTVAGVFLQAVTDDSYTIDYEIVNGIKEVFFDAFGLGPEYNAPDHPRFDIGDFFSANKTEEKFATAALLHTLVEQMYAKTYPNSYTSRMNAYNEAHKVATYEEGLLLFNENLNTRTTLDIKDKTENENIVGRSIFYKTVQTGTVWQYNHYYTNER
jgi:hypothetical protein